MRSKVFRIVSLLIVTFALGSATSGCVSKARYNRLLSENQACEQRSTTAERRLSGLHQQLQAVNAEINPDQAAQDLTDEQLIAQIRAKIGEQPVAQQTQSPEQPNLNILAKYLFPSGSAQLTAEGREILEKVAVWLERSESNHIFVAGYTDDVPIGPNLKRKYASNWELSTARATSVLKYLASRGVPEGKMAAVGYGEHDMVASDMGVSREQSRRVEVRLHNVDFQVVLGKIPEGVEQTALIDINTASARQLVMLPGVSPEFARSVVEYRARAGRIGSYDDLRQVKGFDESNMSSLQTMVSFGSDDTSGREREMRGTGTTTDETRGTTDEMRGTTPTGDKDRDGYQIDDRAREESQELRHDMHQMKEEGKQEVNEMQHDMQQLDDRAREEMRDTEQEINDPD